MVSERVIFLVVAYCIGSVPFGLVLGRIWGLGDIRKIGSGNIGATNVLRAGNKFVAALTLLLDVGKGAAMVGAAYYLGHADLAVAAGALATLGHCYPVFLKFQGGKGVATMVGLLLALDPLTGGVAIAAWIVTALIFRMSSLASLVATGAGAICGALALNPIDGAYLMLVYLLVFIRHRDNIGRLIAGTEPKIGARDTDA